MLLPPHLPPPPLSLDCCCSTWPVSPSTNSSSLFSREEMKQKLKRVTKKSKLQTNLVFFFSVWVVRVTSAWFFFVLFHFYFANKSFVTPAVTNKELSFRHSACSFFLTSWGEFRHDDQSSHIKTNLWFGFSAVSPILLEGEWNTMLSLWAGMKHKPT